jgi:predicted NBD/HSP70 family sugar kinase
MYLLFDIGGTNMRLAISRDGTEIGEPKVIATPKDFKEGMERMESLARELAVGEAIEMIAGGIAGPLNEKKTMLSNSPHIGGWIKKPLQEELEKRLGAPVVLENDTALVGLGEVTVGAAKDYPISVYITVSTGVGGARFVEGRIDRNALGFEPGHQIIEKGITLEDLVSGTGVKTHYGKDPVALKDEKIWDEIAKNLAIGLNNVVVHWSPNVVVLGGAMISGDPSIPWDSLERYYMETVRIFVKPPPLKKGVLGDLGGLYGALELAKQKHV